VQAHAYITARQNARGDDSQRGGARHINVKRTSDKQKKKAQVEPMRMMRDTVDAKDFAKNLSPIPSKHGNQFDASYRDVDDHASIETIKIDTA
jgi:hypothetical protein